MKKILACAKVHGLLIAMSASLSAGANWEKDIAAFEAMDKTNPPPANAIVFVGSSSIRKWKTLGEDFKEWPVINRGFGGSRLADVVQYAERIVIPYRPRHVVVYAGDNDIAFGGSPEKVLVNFKTFAGKILQALPQTRITFLALKPCSSRMRFEEKIRTANRLVSEYVKTDGRLSFVDTFTPLLGSDGKPRDELFLEDKLHLNEEGYALWVVALKPYLK